MKAHSVTVKGIVQGVFFRKYTKQKADELGLSGSVRNLPNGDVHIYVKGDDETVDTFIRWCHSGSPSSKVSEVLIEDSETIQITGFSIEY